LRPVDICEQVGIAEPSPRTNPTASWAPPSASRTGGEAERAAINDCKNKGGASCKLETWYSNGCVALVVGKKVYNVRTGATLDAAVDSGVKTCSKDSRNCRVLFVL
jgi:hypothetical protein